MKSQICSFCCLLFYQVLLAQATFLEKAKEVGIDHYFYNENLMGGVGIQAGLSITTEYATTSVVTGDINNDGYREVFITTRDEQANLLFYNNGDGTFREISHLAGIDKDIAWSTTASFGDLNKDGFLDIYVGNYVENFEYVVDVKSQKITGYAHTCQPNFLYLNNQDNTFTEVAPLMAADNMGCALASVFTDFDNDNDTDLMVINDYGQWVVPNQLLINNGGTLVPGDSSAAVGIYAMGVAVGDYDRDNDLDYYITNIGRNALLNNQGTGHFLEQARESNVEDIQATKDLSVGWGTTFLDIDNDADLDLFVANGFITALSFNQGGLENKDKLFLNTLNNTPTLNNPLSYPIQFEEIADSIGLGDAGKARGCAYADFDKDGDLDIVIVRVTPTHNTQFVEKVLYYENQLKQDNNWLALQLIGKETNRDAYGVHVSVQLDSISWLSEINGGNSHASQNSSIIHLGLGQANHIDSLIIDWSATERQVLTNLLPNQRLIIEENVKSTTNVFTPDLKLNLNLQANPNPFSYSTIIQFDNPSKKDFHLTVLNGQGQVFLSQKIDTTSFSLDKAAMPAGLYWVRLNDLEGKSDAIKVLIL